MSINCKYCNSIKKNLNSLRNHERLCKLNPNRQISNFEKLTFEERQSFNRGKNQYTKAKELDLPKPILSQESKDKTLKTRILNNTLYHSEETKQKISASMKKAVLNNPDSYSKSNRGRTKVIYKYGISFNGSWELLFYEYCLEHNIPIERNSACFPYMYDKERLYIPDFKLLNSNIYIEIKGYETEKDLCKWNGSILIDNKLIILKSKEILEIKNKTFNFNKLVAEVGIEPTLSEL